MAKPILIMRSEQHNVPDIEKLHRLMLENLENEYHLFFLFDPGKYEETTFQVLNGEGLDPIKIEELSQLVLKQADQNATKILSQNIANNPKDFTAEDIEKAINNLYRHG